MELNVAAERSSAARFTARRFFEIDPQECGGLRQGNITLIHSAPTGESGETVIARSTCDEAIHSCFAERWIASLRSQ
jgi:hypothetical protein